MTDRLRNRIVSTGVGKYAVQQSAPVGGTWITQGSSFSDTRNTLTNENYSGNYTGSYAGNYTGSYSGSYRLFYAGFAGTLYTGTYSGTYTGNYSGTYTGTYTGATVNNAVETVSTVSLWMRTA